MELVIYSFMLNIYSRESVFSTVTKLFLTEREVAYIKLVTLKHNYKLEVLGRTNRVLLFDTTRTA
jgi:hypothetical protein